MHLLNVHTRRLEHFHDPPPYAILSHLWTPGEAHRFHEIGTPGIDKKPGYHKVDMCCKLALEDGLDYVWIDTCCADAESTTAFTEALNSSYSWFQNSEVCYVYLDDVDGSEDLESEGSTFRRCRWFKRAWTLQELLAPVNLFFFSSNWSMLGTKVGLATVISDVTGIHRDAILYPSRVPFFSIAARMSWANGRKSSKGEDRVYSLMGLFGVNLPIVYGEGEKNVFIKLQRSIMETSDDQSILAWRSVSSSSSPHTSGPFADSPDCYADCGNVYRIPHCQWLEYCTRYYCSPSGISPRLDFAVTNTGLRIGLPLRRREEDMFDAILACARGVGVWNGDEYVINLEGADLIHIPLRKCTPTAHHYERMGSDRLGTINTHATNNFDFRKICMCAPQRPAYTPQPQRVGAPSFVIRYAAVQRFGFLPTLHPESCWVFDPDTVDGQVLLHPDTDLDQLQPEEAQEGRRIARMGFADSSNSVNFVVELGLDSNPSSRPWVYVGTSAHVGEDENRIFKDFAIWELQTGEIVTVTVRSLPKSARYKVDIRFSPSLNSGPMPGS